MAKIKISHLGKINDAEVKFLKFNIIAGKNNTGKTCAANLIWAVCKLHLVESSARRRRRANWLSNLLKPIDGTERRTEAITPVDTKRIFNSAMKDCG